ncbi:hypothetical protein P8605_08115 [Streptomyces sp. T-3]|nr:hypothetical protein [Streptomyces sp. T-3]
MSVSLGAVSLLAACTSGTTDKAPKALGEKQVRAVVPGAEAMPRWRNSLERSASPVNAHTRKVMCAEAGAGKGRCDGLRYFSTSGFTSPDKTSTVGFNVFAARDEKSAEQVYDALWKRVAAAFSDGKQVRVGELGSARDSVRVEYGPSGRPAALVQVRVGTSVLQISVQAVGEKGRIDDAVIKDLAALLTERADQAAEGSAPTAVLSS